MKYLYLRHGTNILVKVIKVKKTETYMRHESKLEKMGQNIFSHACRKNYMKMAQWIHGLAVSNEAPDWMLDGEERYIMYGCCKKGHIDMAKLVGRGVQVK